MKTIGAFEAKTHLSDLLKKVGHGESFLITKRGKPVASLSPITSTKHQSPWDIIDEHRREFAKSLKKITLDEINEWKSLGRK